MTALRVVVYAEGTYELRATHDLGYAPRPGALLHDDGRGDVGAGHILVRRMIALETEYPESAVQFEEGLRVHGRVARGSHLLRPDTIRQLLGWFSGLPSAPKRPDLVVLLVDEDGDATRVHALMEHVSDHAFPVVVAVAVREFEAWLIADERAVVNVLGASLGIHAPEELEPGDAKQRLTEALNGRDPHVTRAELAEHADLAVVRDKCVSFNAFAAEIRRLVQE